MRPLQQGRNRLIKTRKKRKTIKDKKSPDAAEEKKKNLRGVKNASCRGKKFDSGLPKLKPGSLQDWTKDGRQKVSKEPKIKENHGGADNGGKGGEEK